MNWDRLVRGFRRALGYLNPVSEKDDRDEDESNLGSKGWFGSGDQPAFPQAREPAFARIPK